MAYGIGQEIEDLTELGVDELTRRHSIDPQLKYALALQEATNIVNAAARERDMAMEQPQPPEVIGQLEQGLAERLMPGVSQMIQQQPQQPMMEQGVSAVPAPNMMMSGGGIVSFAEGGELIEGITEVGQQAIGKEKQVSWLDRLLERVFPERSDAEKEAFENRPRPGSDEWREQQYISSGGIPTPYMRGEDAERFRRNFDVPTLGAPALLPETETFLNATEILDNPESTAEQKAFAQMQLEGLKDAPMRAEMLQQVEKIRSARRGMARGGIVGLANGGPLAAPQRDFEIMLDKEGITDTRERAFARAIFAAESSSGTHPDTWTDRGAGRPIGSMQIGAAAFADVADEGWNRLNAEHNMRAGIRYAMEGYRKARGNPEAAGAYYYGGPQGLKAWERGEALSDRDQPSFPDTLQYGRQIAETMPSYIQQDEAVLTGRSSVADQQANILEEVLRGAWGKVGDVATDVTDLVVDRYGGARPAVPVNEEEEIARRNQAQRAADSARELIAARETEDTGGIGGVLRNLLGYTTAKDAALCVPDDVTGIAAEARRAADSAQELVARREDTPDRSGYSIDGIKAALVNLLDLGPRERGAETYTDAAGNEYPTDPTALQHIESIMELPTKEELDAEAEINLLNAAQDRADAERLDSPPTTAATPAQGWADFLGYDSVEEAKAALARRQAARRNTSPTPAEEKSYAPGVIGDIKEIGDYLRRILGFQAGGRVNFQPGGEVGGAATYTDAAGNEYPTNPTAVQKIQSIIDLAPPEEVAAAGGKEALLLRLLRYAGLDYESLVSGIPSLEELTTPLPEDAPGGYRVGTRGRDIATAPTDVLWGFLHPEKGPTLGDIWGVGGDVLRGLIGLDTPTEEVVTEGEEVVRTDSESGDPVTTLLEGEEVGVTDRDVYGDTLISSTDEEVDTPSGSRFTIKSPPPGATRTASSVQDRYNELTQPQSGSEAFFDLLKTLGGGGGRSEGYEFAGISERGAELDAARNKEAMDIIEAESRLKAIEAQNQTNETRFVENYVQANRGTGKTDAQLAVEASQIYLRANNIYAGQTNRIEGYSNLVESLVKNLADPYVRAHRDAVRAHGAGSTEAKAAFEAILNQAQQIYERGYELPGV